MEIFIYIVFCVFCILVGGIIGIALSRWVRRDTDKQVKDMIELIEDPKDMIENFEKNLQEKSGMFEEARRTAQATESKPESQEPSKPSSRSRS